MRQLCVYCGSYVLPPQLLSASTVALISFRRDSYLASAATLVVSTAALALTIYRTKNTVSSRPKTRSLRRSGEICFCTCSCFSFCHSRRESASALASRNDPTAKTCTKSVSFTARLQPCRKCFNSNAALAAEVRFWKKRLLPQQPKH